MTLAANVAERLGLESEEQVLALLADVRSPALDQFKKDLPYARTSSLLALMNGGEELAAYLEIKLDDVQLDLTNQPMLILIAGSHAICAELDARIPPRGNRIMDEALKAASTPSES